jgi:hypothetical protein
MKPIGAEKEKKKLKERRGRVNRKKEKTNIKRQ